MTATPKRDQTSPPSTMSGLVWGSDEPLPEVEGVPTDVAADLVERRVRRGFERKQSVEALREVMALHGDSPNLKDILIGERFASRLSGERAVARIAAERSPGRIPSERPQSAPVTVIRKGDIFADGEFSTYEKVQSVTDFGDMIAINTDASLDAGANPYEFRKSDSVWAITR